MSAAQSDTFSPYNSVLLCVLLLIAVFLGEVVFPTHGNQDEMVEAVDTVEDIALRIAPVVVLAEMQSSPMAAGAGADTSSQSPEEMYQAACLACHTTGAAGAPKIGDVAEWASRAAKGLDALLSGAINGVGAMPPRGGSQFDDDQIKAVVEYILEQSK
ncbi:MAG: c-type cytochrome [Pseudomonadota bacterium]